MRAALHIILSCYLLIISAGVPFYSHVCMGELKEHTVVVGELDMKPCCSSMGERSGCCDHEVTLEKTQEQQTFSFGFQLAPATLVAVIDHFTPYAPLAETGLNEGYPTDTSPPRSGPALSILFQNFRC
ncbi:hypothetical protein AB9P05_02125 [Roseivirga sp. BDSF3-8]|uniref:HYC_CC_PP family protein n=1 Tax=Roseivirga sp. BDSF3-8 TaxID=3241598 RepID=UPI003531A4B6